MADEQLRMALIGTGHMGHNYIRMLQEHADGPICLSAAVARHEPARNWLCEHYPDIIIYNSADELYALGGSAFDATLVVTPQATHPAMVSQAFDHGKHVLCDKPAGMSVGHAAPMLKAASAHPDLAFGMIFQQRFYARHQRIKQILDSGALGTVKRVQLTDSQYFRTHFYHRTAPWRSSWHGEKAAACSSRKDLIFSICGNGCSACPQPSAPSFPSANTMILQWMTKRHW